MTQLHIAHNQLMLFSSVAFVVPGQDPVRRLVTGGGNDAEAGVAAEVATGITVRSLVQTRLVGHEKTETAAPVTAIKARNAKRRRRAAVTTRTATRKLAAAY
jgi:hypothetical protein